MKGIGDGEPIASERFSVGGHEWVRLKHFQTCGDSRLPTCTVLQSLSSLPVAGTFVLS